MKAFRLTRALARSASQVAIAAAILTPSLALAQGAPPVISPTQGTPQADTNAAAPPLSVQEKGAIATNAQPAASVDNAVADEVVVTGVRASLERSIAIKRDSFGIVDAISAEDIGKFPDTNLAESLQRITGVSIDRVNGEGSTVTVRGFGADYNLVTLNGRTLAASYDQSVGGDVNGDGVQGFGRSFDFSNIATEGVRTLEVYKTGRAAVPSGGIGATINVVTRRPLDTNQSGFSGSLGVKADYDESASNCDHCGSVVTPDTTGYVSWASDDHRFGGSLFASYSQRHFSVPSATSQDWNVRSVEDFLNPANGLVNAATKLTNTPPAGTLVSFPNDSRYSFSDDKYERFNTQGVFQFKPIDSVTVTVDGLYVRNSEEERRSDDSNWFNRPFGQVTFDKPTDGVASAVFLQENIGGGTGVKDVDFENQDRAQLNELQDYGLNAKWRALDNLTLSVDGHFSKSSVTPDNPNGASSTTIGLASNVVGAHSLDYTNGIPITHITVNDTLQGNSNGVLDIGDIGTNHGRQFFSSQSQELQEYRFDGDWDLGEGSHVTFGVDYRDSRTRASFVATDQTLGDWGVTDDGTVAQVAGDLVQQFCLTCKFSDFKAPTTGPDAVAFRGDPTSIYNRLSAYYTGLGHTTNTTGDSNNTVEEKIAAAYTQLQWKGELFGHRAAVVTGVRYEYTDTAARSLLRVPNAIVWQADNDFNVTLQPNTSGVTGHGHYDNVLPSIDFQVDLKKNLIFRVSASRTIARTQYGNLFSNTGVGVPPRPTAIGGIATASEGNTALLPLTSNNFDTSLEWYYKKDSYVSVGFFDKRVDNFVGSGSTTGSLFGLRDASSGAAGTRSGTAKQQLTGIGADLTDVNLFTLTALIQQNNGNAAAALTQFQSHYNAGTRSLDQAFVNSELAAVDLTGNPEDPLFNFLITQPVNNKSAQIYGFEFAGQHFFGDTGLGLGASYTHVDGDISFNNAGDPGTGQFALTGLSDTANITLIYDKHGLSARVAYNWRDRFLQGLNRGSYLNPVYVAPYGTLDANISYDITPHLAISLEALNLTQETYRTYARDEPDFWQYQELDRRFLLGARYRF